jgi:hypothetical protein
MDLKYILSSRRECLWRALGEQKAAQTAARTVSSTAFPRDDCKPVVRHDVLCPEKYACTLT